MSKALEGMHYCKEHQGNQSHYAIENCEVCRLRAEVASLKELNKLDKEVHSKMPELVGEIAHLTQQLAAAQEQNAILTVQVQEGWKLVPVEPTEEMLFAAETSHVRGYRDLYSVMIAAAPDLPQQVKSEDDDTALLNAIQENSWDLVSRTLTSGDDCEIGWQVIEHHMAKPYERVIGENFQDDARAAIRAALSAQGSKG